MKRFATASGDAPVLHRNTANLMQNVLDEVKKSITVLPELQSLIPALQTAEYEQLEANIRKDGCREALLIWQTTQGVIDNSDNDSPLNVLIDGHNRYAICTQHGIDFKVMLREFPTLQAVREFMIENQLGRRNLTPEQMSYLRGLKYRNERQAAGRPVQEEDAETKTGQRTQDRLAKEFNVSPRTIHRDREFSEGIDKLTPELKQDVLRGNQKIAKDVIRALGRSAQPIASPLSLADLVAFQEPDQPEIAKPTGNKAKVNRMVTEIANTVSKLDPEAPTFAAVCDRIIQLVQEAKEMMSRKK
ncbi:hypothetical protein [Larkinella rosea]|uniref:ParB/Sulfiredoxin domain-containing protein n=1 Tax=Larkinella rosea TaxID=2025312 RepID=A0A3P1BV64_9BACT|nr:hypothetical protein [Larkinella rosea]RRB04753.1 hypothetical protein EHT25_14905 [Larkinella rosea]